MIDVGKNEQVIVNKGDSMFFTLFINRGNEIEPVRYILQDTDEIHFYILNSGKDFEEPVLERIFTNKNLNKYGDVEILIRPSDTADLLPGTYYYKIKLKIKTKTTDEIHTVVDKTKLIYTIVDNTKIELTA